MFYLQGKAIYAQIPETEVERKGSQLSLDRVYTIRRFNVRTSKMNYMPFDAELMLEITSFTTITPSNISMNAFPTLIYNITPLNEIKTTGQACSKYIGKFYFFLPLILNTAYHPTQTLTVIYKHLHAF